MACPRPLPAQVKPSKCSSLQHRLHPLPPPPTVPMMRTQSRNDREVPPGAAWVGASAGQSSGDYYRLEGPTPGELREENKKTPCHPLSLSLPTGSERSRSKPSSHAQRVRSASRPSDRDPATAQNAEYTPPVTRHKSSFSKK